MSTTNAEFAEAEIVAEHSNNKCCLSFLFLVLLFGVPFWDSVTVEDIVAKVRSSLELSLSLSHSKLRAFPCLISTFQATFQIVFADCFRVASGFVFWVCGHGGVFIMWRCLQ